MSQLELSITWEMLEPIQRALQQFTEETNIKVDVLTNQDRSQLSDFAIHRVGPDVSEIGSTWLSNLVTMVALRPFSDKEIAALGGSAAFLPACWRASIRENAVYAVPWRGDTRLIYYRRDLLAQSGIDEPTAFATVAQMQQTLGRLKASAGDIIPWVMSSDKHSMLIHQLAPFIWQTGGHFITPDGRRTLFCEPAALDGIQTYFETFAPVIRPATQNLTDQAAHTLYREGKAAAILTGHWLANDLRRQHALPVVSENTAIAFHPGAQYSGNMSLVIWQHSRKAQEALKLVQFLTRPDIQAGKVQQAFHLPVRQEVLSAPPYTTEPDYQVIKRSLETGQHLSAAYMWGLVEDQLTQAIYALWQTLHANPQTDLRPAIEAKLKPLAVRLDRTFSSQ